MWKRTVRALARRLAWPLRASRFVSPERVFRHLHFKGPFALRLPNGRAITLQSWGNRVENELAWRGWDGHEPVERRLWAAMVKTHGDVLDIGANTGTFAFQAKGLREEAKVVAVEPLRRIAARIKQNAETSGLAVEVQNVAVSDVTGRLPIHDPGGDNAYSASLAEDFLPGDKDVYEVEVVTIDELCRREGLRPTSIKLDVEGVEARALLGARATLQRGECVILCEWLGKEKESGDALTLLSDTGYVGLDCETLEPVELARQASYAHRNVLLVPEGRLEEVKRSWPRHSQPHGV